MRTPKELRARYKALFESDDGEVVLDDLRKRFHIFGTTFSTDSHEQAYCEGSAQSFCSYNPCCPTM